LTSVDDISALSVAEIVVAGGYSISGNAITLTGSGGVGVDNQTGTNILNNPITLGTNVSFTEDAGQLAVGGVVSGSGGLTKSGAGTLVLSASDRYTGATTISAGIVSAVASNVFGGTTAVTIGAGAELDLSGGINISSPISAMSGAGTTGNGAIVNTAGANVLTGPITLAGNTTIGVNAGQLTLSGAIGDNGLGYGLTLAGGGTFILSGGSPNTYGGATTLVASTLDLSKTVQNSIPGALVIGNGVNAALVQETSSDQIGNSATVSVNALGTLDLNNNNDAFFGLSMTGGTVQTETGTITLYGDVTTNAASSTAVIAGNVALSPANGSTRTFTVAGGTVPNNGPDLLVSAQLSGSVAISKAGSGTLALSGANSYTGITTVSAGTLSIGADNSLGLAPSAATPGSFVLSGGTLATTASFKLSANRGMSVSGSGGAIDVGSGTTLTYSGILAGAGGLSKTDAGTLVLGGFNTYSGVTTISGGTLQVGTGATSGGALGTGAVIDAAALSFDRTDNITVANAITGTGSVTETGGASGSLTLSSGTNAFSDHPLGKGRRRQCELRRSRLGPGHDGRQHDPGPRRQQSDGRALEHERDRQRREHHE